VVGWREDFANDLLFLEAAGSRRYESNRRGSSREGATSSGGAEGEGMVDEVL